VTRAEKIARRYDRDGRKRKPQNQRLVVKVYLSGRPGQCMEVYPQRIGNMLPFWKGTPTAADMRKVGGKQGCYFYAHWNGERYLLDGYAPEQD